MELKDLVAGKHIVFAKSIHDDDIETLFVLDNCVVGICGTSTWFPRYTLGDYHDILKIGVAKTNADYNHLLKDTNIDKLDNRVNWEWTKEEDKVECIIDGQKIMLSRESVEELKKLK